MVKKHKPKSSQSGSSRSAPIGNLENPTSFCALLDAIDPERDAQRQEYLRRIAKKDDASAEQVAPLSKPPNANKPRKPKAMSFDEKLAITQAWLEETFPLLFDSSQPWKPLDIHIVRDVKNHYKQWRVKKNYPPDLVIKAALYRHMESPAYLQCLKKGAPRYGIDGQIVGTV